MNKLRKIIFFCALFFQGHLFAQENCQRLLDDLMAQTQHVSYLNRVLKLTVNKNESRLKLDHEKVKILKDELKSAHEELGFAETTMDIQIANYNVVDAAQKLIKAYGYEAKAVDVDEYGSPFFEITSAPRGTSSGAFINSMFDGEVKVMIGGSSNGHYESDTRSLFLTPLHMLLDENFLSTTMLHEGLHQMIRDDVAKGVQSPFDATLITTSASPYANISNVKHYTNFFAFDELATHIMDVALLEKGVPSIFVDAVKNQFRQSMLAEKTSQVRSMANEIKLITTKLLNLENNQLAKKTTFKTDPDLKNVPTAEIEFESTTGEMAILKVWLPEVIDREMGEEKLLQALRKKVSLMQDKAIQAFESSEITIDLLK